MEGVKDGEHQAGMVQEWGSASHGAWKSSKATSHLDADISKLLHQNNRVKMSFSVSNEGNKC